MALCNNTLNAKNGVPMQKNTTVEKQCSTCRRVLPLSKFRRYKHQSGDSGYRGCCRECESKAEALRYHQKKMECTTCKQILPLSKFRRYKNRSGSIGYRGSCIECEKEQNRKRHQQKKAQLDVDNDEKPDLFRSMDQYKKIKGG